MALYISNARRARRTALIALAAAVLALVAGWAIGRAQVPSIDSRVDEVRAEGAQIATSVERLDIEYEQALANTGDSVKAGVLSPLDDDRVALQHTMDRAPWITSTQRSKLLDSLASVESGARGHIPLAEFRARITASGALIRTTLGDQA